jgi:DHA2 family multidrug resistance protein
MGYTATWAGLATAPAGVTAVILSPIVPLLMRRFDARALVTFGVGGLGLVALWRTGFASNAAFETVAITFLAQGIAMPFFFVPTTQIALTSVSPEETASAAGLSNFLRTISAAICAALATTWWDDAGTRNHANIAGALHDTSGFASTLTHAGLSPAQALAQLENVTQNQAVMLATDQMFWIITGAFLIAACVVWLAPKPRIFSGPMGGGH